MTCAKRLRRRGAQGFRGGELRAVEIRQHRQDAHHHARNQVVRRRERKSRWREQRFAGERRIDTGVGEQLRDEPSATVTEYEPVGDDQSGKGERQRDHEREQRARSIGQLGEVQRNTQPDQRRHARRCERQHEAAADC
jgi:hypothetical protein